MPRRIALALTLVVLSFVGVRAQSPIAVPPSEQAVHDVATQLRCVVCQNLSVADSPSEMAQQMRALIRERLAAGDTPDQVVQYFVERYGEWILLAPPRRGFTLLVWVLPPLAVVAGLILVAVLLVRWTRGPRTATVNATTVDPAMRERIKREMELDA